MLCPGGRQHALAAKRANARPILHVSCAASREDTATYLQRGLDAGICDILALPRGSGGDSAAAEFASVCDLVSFVAARFGSRVRIAVCGYPWGTGEADSYEEGLTALAMQVVPRDCTASSPGRRRICR